MGILEQFLQFLQQGIAAIFRFVQLVWSWASAQIVKVASTPWQSWPLWKQILLVIVAAGVAWALYRAARQLWDAGEKILTAFAGLLTVLIKTLPHVVLAGAIALGGIWVLNNIQLNF
jgi:hypothetical protein